MNRKQILLNIADNQNIIFCSVCLFIIFKFLLKNILTNNELDVLVYAKHWMNPSWIPADWYLNLDIGYRALFNSFSGGLSKFFSLTYVSIIGRFCSFVLFAFAMTKLSRLYKLSIFMVILFLYLYFRYYNLVAGEWMLGALETKVFAYISVLIAIYYLIRKNYFLSFGFLGLSLSFHILVGIFASFAYICAVLINVNFFKDDMRRILINAILYFITGCYGIIAVIQELLKQKTDINQIASLIYVHIRVPHHVLPSHWSGHDWLIKIALFVAILFPVFILIKDMAWRIISSFALSSLLLFGIGLIFFKTGNIALLKYYWFRFPDVILPFFGLLIFFALIENGIKYLIAKDTLPFYLTRTTQIFKLLFASTACIIFLSSFYSFAKDAIAMSNMSRNDVPFYLNRMPQSKFDLYQWIYNNTDKNAIFLVNPFMADFYLGTERAMFVSFKHSPQSEKDIFEWYKRMKICNGDNELVEGFKNKNMVENAFYSLSEARLKKIMGQYKVNYYLANEKKDFNFPLVYTNGTFYVYALSNEFKE